VSRETGPFLAELADWVAGRPDTGAEHRYGPLPDQHGVLRLPAGGEGLHPVAVVVHGGFWRAEYTKSNTTAIAIALAGLGFATWNVEYRRLGSGGGYPETLADVSAACRALAELDEPLDLDRTLAIGHSAGGHLALYAAAEGLVGAAVSLAGVDDFASAVAGRLGGDAVREFLGGPPEAQEERYRRADPMRRVPLGTPILLVHGTDDDRVPVEQSRSFAAAARAAGDDVCLLELPGGDHFDVIDPRSGHWPAIAGAVAGLVS
jgi:dipeptidyl aminopeptidase/acylaminoacyl peptidase